MTKSCLFLGSILLLAAVVPGAMRAQGPEADKNSYKPDPRAKWQDSFRYYGPQGLWKSWTPQQKAGRDTWIFWTGGNEKFLRNGTKLGGSFTVPISIDFFRMLDTRNRGKRFQMLGLINEPNCEEAKEPEKETGLWLDKWNGDPEKDYPPTEIYGLPTGIVGLRKFKNPSFWGTTAEAQANKQKWNVTEYFKAPGKFEPPYLIGFSCAICHIAFDPTNPPQDPANPRWENLAANIGNQYFREGDLFFARGRIIFGDRNPDPKFPNDPYKTGGLDSSSFLYHYAVTQPLGTSETSRISYDFINNPTIINTVSNLPHRPLFVEKTLDGKQRVVNHVLADGADSVGLQIALLRVWINIGCEGIYWSSESLFNPLTGQRQQPLNIDELLMNDKVSAARKKELKAKYGDDVGKDWRDAWQRNPDLVSYLSSYGGYSLSNAVENLGAQAALEKDPGVKKRLDAELAWVTKWLPDEKQVERGKRVFAKNCVECHSSKLPSYPLDDNAAQHRKYLEDSVFKKDFLAGNTLSNDKRYSVARLKTNMGRALGTNAIDDDVWARFSSVTYKSLPPVGTFEFDYAIDKGRLVPKAKGTAPGSDIHVRFTPPGGGRGYYRSPTLVNLWATAPYLHNNSVGDYWVVQRDDKGKISSKKKWANDGNPPVDEIDVSLEGRLKMFDDGVEKLLWPEKRHNYMIRTLTDSQLVDLAPIVKKMLPGIVHDWIFELVQSEISKGIKNLIENKKLSPETGEALQKKLTGFAKELEQLRQELSPQDLEKLRERLGTLVKTSLIAQVEKMLPAPIVKAAVAELDSIHQQIGQEINDLLKFSFLQIPAGTPVNLYFNLPASGVPYALKAQIKYRNNPRMLADTLLRLSNCPDLVEDRGHEFGAELSDADKRDLIEFLKTF